MLSLYVNISTDIQFVFSKATDGRPIISEDDNARKFSVAVSLLELQQCMFMNQSQNFPLRKHGSDYKSFSAYPIVRIKKLIRDNLNTK